VTLITEAILLSQMKNAEKPTFPIHMKRQILLLAAVAVSTFALAQSKPTFTVRGGVVSAGMKGDAVKSLQNIIDVTDGMITTGSKTGLYGGGTVSIPVSEKFSIEPGVYYAQKGYELKGALDLKGIEFLGINAKAQLKSQYIDIPVLAKANFNGFQVFAGPQVSYMTKADLKTSAGVLGINLLNKSIDVTDEFNRWDAGITGGVGYQFKNGFSISAAYDHGLSKVDANKSADAYNRSVRIGLGISF
jgi:hypothetical protein